MEFALKRIYDPASPEDGYRVLVDRLWPRGVKKADADISCWAKEITPSPDLRKWFHEDKEGRFKTFSERSRIPQRLGNLFALFRKALIG